MSKQPIVSNVASPEGRVRRSYRTKIRPVLSALGFVPAGDPLPALSQWRRSAGQSS